MSQPLFGRMALAVTQGEPEEAAELARRALAENVEPLEAINQGYTVGINRVGQLFAKGEFYLPDLMRAAEAMKAAIRVLEPELARGGKRRDVLGTVVIGTVQGDIHEIGKSLVATMLSANGFQVYDLGVNVKAETFVDKVREVNADLLGLSALLTTTMLAQRRVIQALNEAALRARVKVIVGGAPVTKTWAEEIGADGYAESAASSVALARRLVTLPPDS